jgi:uncharacterized protein YebE (UPF0316 family)
MSANSLVAPLTMAGLAMASVGMWTLRVALTARGRKAAGAIVAAAEAVVFALAFTRLASGLDAPERVAAYAVGVAVGTVLGLAIDERLSAGQSELRVVVPGPGTPLVQALERFTCSTTSLGAAGPEGPVTLVFVTVSDSRLAALVETVRRIVPEASWTVHPLDKGHASVPLHDCFAGAVARNGPWRRSRHTRPGVGRVVHGAQE